MSDNVTTNEKFTMWPKDDAERYRRAGLWKGIPLGTALTAVAGKHPNATAGVDRYRRISHGQLRAEADKVAHGLLALGVHPGDRVVVQLPNVVEFLTVTVGMLRAGIIPVLSLPGHRRTEIEHLVEAAEAVGYVTIDRFQGFDYRKLARHLKETSPDLLCVVCGHAQEFTSLDAVEATGAASTIGSLPDVDPEGVALLLLSGGSTGYPKLIPRTHDDYAFNIRACAEALRFGADSVYLAVNPAAHNAALGCPGVWGALLVGATAVFAASPAPDEAFDLIEREGVTHTTVVPAVAALWSTASTTRKVDMSNVLLQVGSAKFDSEMARDTGRALGCRISNWFGIGEGLLTYTRLDDPDEIIHGTEGRPLSVYDEVRIVNEKLRDVPPGEVGELITRGPYTIRGYWNAPTANRTAFTPNGFFRTGDLARITLDGNVFVAGRVKDVINRGGEKVSADEVETHLRSHDAISEVALVGRPDSVLGEASVAYVVLSRGDEISLSELKRYLTAKGLAVFKLPDDLRLLPALPRTPVGKIDKARLRADEAGSAQTG